MVVLEYSSLVYTFEYKVLYVMKSRYFISRLKCALCVDWEHSRELYSKPKSSY